MNNTYYIVWDGITAKKTFTNYNDALNYYFDLCDVCEIVELSDNHGNALKRSW